MLSNAKYGIERYPGSPNAPLAIRIRNPSSKVLLVLQSDRVTARRHSGSVDIHCGRLRPKEHFDRRFIGQVRRLVNPKSPNDRKEKRERSDALPRAQLP